MHSVPVRSLLCAALAFGVGAVAQGKPAPKSLHEAMAEKVVAAVAADDHAAILALMSKAGREELSTVSARGFRTLRTRLKTEGIDLAKAKILRVVPGPGMGIQMVDVFLDHGGREFQMHFSAMTLGGRYDLMGVAVWIKWTQPPAAKPAP